MLAAGILGGAFLVWGALRLLGRYARPEPGRFELLAPREAAFLAASADALYPPGGVVPPSGSEAGIPEYVDRYLGVVPARVRLLMRLLFLLVDGDTRGGEALGNAEKLLPEHLANLALGVDEDHRAHTTRRQG